MILANKTYFLAQIGQIWLNMDWKNHLYWLGLSLLGLSYDKVLKNDVPPRAEKHTTPGETKFHTPSSLNAFNTCIQI